MVHSRNVGPYGAGEISFSFWNTLKETWCFRIDADGSNTSFIYFTSKNTVCFFSSLSSLPASLLLSLYSFLLCLKKWPGKWKSLRFFFCSIIKKYIFCFLRVLVYMSTNWFWGRYLCCDISPECIYFSSQNPQRLDVWSGNKILRNFGPWKPPELNISCLHN